MRASRGTPAEPTATRFASLLCVFCATLALLPLTAAARPPKGPPFTPLLHTQASSSVSLGGSISDVSSLVGQPLGPAPTGTIVFNLYGPDDPTCARKPVFTSPAIAVRLTNRSGAFKPTAPGTYQWVATYTSADKTYLSGITKCADPNEAVLVTAVTPTLTTTASASVAVGGSVTDTAALSGGMNPTGSIEFGLFGPSDPNCAGGVVFRSTVAISDPNSTVSQAYSPPVPGTYHWEARYVGDHVNGPIRSGCADAGESVVVTGGPAAPVGPGPSKPPGSGPSRTVCDAAASARAVLNALSATLTGQPGAGFRSTCSAGLRIVLRAKEIRPGNPGFPRRDGFTTMTNILTHIAPNGPALNFSLNQNGLALRGYALSHRQRLIAFLVVHVRPDRSQVSRERLQILTLG